MSDTQLKAPNLSVKGVPGECLVYVREVFGVGAKYPTAASGWANAAYKHTGSPPSDIAVPVWFSWESSGHVAVSVPGKGVYSTTAQGDKVFGNVQEVASYVGATYLGWSEDVDGVRVAEVGAAPSGQTIFLPPTTGPWHLYKVGGPYNPAVPADVKGILKPSEFGGLTYNIVANRGNGVYTVNTQDFGEGDLWTDGSSVVIK